jgi:RNA 3'-terminal phosphate cyclase (ATP)
LKTGGCYTFAVAPAAGGTTTRRKSTMKRRNPSMEKEMNDHGPLKSMVADDNDGDAERERIEIDGSLGEGGGQILRNAISYAALLQTPIRIINIRAGRSKPGLRAQHATGLRLVAQLANGSLTGASVESTVIEYTPPPPNTTSSATGSDTPSYRHENPVVKSDIGTAGSICLLLQAALPVALLMRQRETRLQLKGGTNADKAPQYDYWSMVFLPTLAEQCGLVLDAGDGAMNAPSVHPIVLRRGFFPKGGGEIHVVVTPRSSGDGPLRPIRLTDQGTVQKLSIRSFHAGKIPRQVAVDMAKAAERRLHETNIFHAVAIDTEIVTETNALDAACGILIVATTSTNCRLAGSGLGSAKTVKANVINAIGQNAAQELIDAWHDGGCVDEWLQDQLILYAALADGESVIRTGSLTLHTQTAILVAERMTGVEFTVQRVDVDGKKTSGDGVSYDEAYGKDGRISGQHLIRCNGIGFRNKNRAG